jgi:Protein of unknown function (DUF2786)
MPASPEAIMNAPNARDSLLARIHKLREVTESRGATEAEALTAANLIASLIRQYDITADELSVRRDAAACRTDAFTELNPRDDWLTLPTLIASLYTCRVWMQTTAEDSLGIGLTLKVRHMKFFGIPTDVTAATATCMILYTALQSDSTAFKGCRASFRLGMIDRLAARLQEMIAAARPPAGSTGTALVPLKNALVAEEFKKLGMRLGSARHTARIAADAASYNAGSAAGSRVDLGGGKLAANGQRRLGSR